MRIIFTLLLTLCFSTSAIAQRSDGVGSSKYPTISANGGGNGNGNNSGVSKEVGEFVFKKSAMFIDMGDELAQGYFGIREGVFVDFALIYPRVAAGYPEMVVGSDFVLTASDVDIFLRNSAGANSAAEGALQGFATNVDGITVLDANPSGRQQNRRIGGSNAAHAQEVTATRTLQGGAIETRPVNKGYQLYLKLDNY